MNRALDDADLDLFVDTLVRRLASFDRQVLAANLGSCPSDNKQPPSASSRSQAWPTVLC